MAYDGWLVGHARWFHSRAGERLLDAIARWADAQRGSLRDDTCTQSRPTSPRTGIEIAGFITTLLGIWLTTTRLLICWPVTLLADFLYLVVFYRAAVLRRAAAGLLCRLHALWLVALVARRARRGRGARGAACARAAALPRLAAGAVGAVLLSA